MSNISLPSISMGLDAIFADVKSNSGILQINVSQIVPSPFQARQLFDENTLQELADSIAQHGILQPLLVREIMSSDNAQTQHYELLAGERRWRAAQRIHLKTVPVVISNVDNATAMAFGLIENIQRHNLNPIEEANAYERLLTEFKFSHEDLSVKLGKSRSHITNLLRLNRLPEVIKQHVIDEHMTMGHARALLTLSPDQQLVMSECIVRRGMSVRETEMWIKKFFSHSENEPIKNAVNLEHLKQIQDWENQLNTHNAAKFKIDVNDQGKGRITVLVDSHEALQALIKKLA